MICGDDQGTPRGAFRHKNNRDPYCDPCREAYNEYHRQWVAARRKESDRKTIKSVVIDVLVTQDRWLSTELLVDFVLSLHPEWKKESVQRAIWRMAADGLLESRTLEHTYTDTYSRYRPGRIRTIRVAEFRADDAVWDRVCVA